MIEVIGTIGSVCMALCGAPLAYEAWRHKQIDINTSFLTIWTLGEVFSTIYIWGDWVLMINYCFNLLFLSIIWKYRNN